MVAEVSSVCSVESIWLVVGDSDTLVSSLSSAPQADAVSAITTARASTRALLLAGRLPVCLISASFDRRATPNLKIVRQYVRPVKCD